MCIKEKGRSLRRQVPNKLWRGYQGYGVKCIINIKKKIYERGWLSHMYVVVVDEYLIKSKLCPYYNKMRGGDPMFKKSDNIINMKDFGKIDLKIQE